MGRIPSTVRFAGNGDESRVREVGSQVVARMRCLSLSGLSEIGNGPKQRVSVDRMKRPERAHMLAFQEQEFEFYIRSFE